MSIAVFFQKHNKCVFSRALKKIYLSLFVRSNKQRIRYLRKAGAIIGEGTTVGSISSFGSEPFLVEIGNNVRFSSNVVLSTHDGAISQLQYMGFVDKKYTVFGRIKIGDNCFIGTNSIILKNVTIGKNCIIGAGSVVTKNIPDNSVACGVPAKVVGNVLDFYEKNKELFDIESSKTIYEKRLYVEKKGIMLDGVSKNK